MPPNNLQLQCQECDKAFNTEQELKLHKNIKHNKAAIKPQNVNSSDSSDDDQSLKRYKEKFAKKKPETRVEPKKGDEDKLDKSMSIPGVFDDTNIEKDAFRKIYLCGCSHKLFQSSQMLTLHISKQHNGFPPQGTLYGVCRDSVMRNFQPMEQRPQQIIRSFIQKAQFICGCGQAFTRQTSLLFHIKAMHNDVPPTGTQGISDIDQDGDLFEGTFSASDSLSIGEKQEQYRRCVACFEPLKDIFWACENCSEWKICAKCGQDEEIKQTHQADGHLVRKEQKAN